MKDFREMQVWHKGHKLAIEIWCNRQKSEERGKNSPNASVSRGQKGFDAGVSFYNGIENILKQTFLAYDKDIPNAEKTRNNMATETLKHGNEEKFKKLYLYQCILVSVAKY